MYKIGFTLGDDSGDGHGKYDSYHIECNYSVEDISTAYRKFVEEVGFDFLDDLDEYENNCIFEKHVSKFVELGLINKDDVERDGGYIICSCEDLIDLFFNIISLQLSGFQWDYRNLEEETLFELDGAGYGLYWS